MIYITRNILGAFAFDENMNLVEYISFGKNPKKIAEKLKKEITEEEKKLVEKYGGIIERKINGYKYEVPNPAGKYLRKNLEKVLEKIGISKEDYYSLLHKVSLELGRQEIKESFSERDRIIIHAVGALEDINEVINILESRVKEWYSLHFPELAEKTSHEKYLKLIAEYGHRSDFEEYRELAEKSIGSDLSRKDTGIIAYLAAIVYDIYKYRDALENYITEVMEKYAPNLKHLVGPILGAKLIALANGLKNLANMPASTIQVLGAEKSLFKHLRGKAPPPKHGIIFQHPFIRQAKKWQRGKIARSFAAKIAIAARADAYSNDFIADELKDKIMKRVEEIKEKFKLPPKKKRKSKRKRKRI